MTPACSAGGKTLANGGLDVSFTYLSGAVAARRRTSCCPIRSTSATPAFADFYAHASFTNTAGVTFHGNVIRPGIAPIEGGPNPDGAHDVLKNIREPRGPARDLPLPHADLYAAATRRRSRATSARSASGGWR